MTLDASRVRRARDAVYDARAVLVHERTQIALLNQRREFLEPGAEVSPRFAIDLADVVVELSAAEDRYQKALWERWKAETELSDVLSRYKDLDHRRRASLADQGERLEESRWQVHRDSPGQMDRVVVDAPQSNTIDSRVVAEPKPVAGGGATRTRMRSPEVVADAEGVDTSPDPLRARTPDDFMAALRELHEWAGKPSFRAMAQRSERSASYLCRVLKVEGLPAYDQVMAFVVGCGGSDQTLRPWISAWRKLNRAQGSGVVPSTASDAPNAGGPGSDSDADTAAVIRLPPRTG
ncbi:hypothetical protein ACFO4E_13185 [Nocardiopsis mangrovi]|uniref:Helix-turn-helix domain-containing protein n=1 Tax=Nocardiopsis mangrovi TaxID=1179818 RepID=A0ABV9DVA0_9ACTN